MLLLVAANTSFQHTAARRRLVFWVYNLVAWFEFQHTAARRRLVGRIFKTADSMTVSTHSRPKAAGTDCRAWRSLYVRCFNTQPPEGGWTSKASLIFSCWRFNTQPPEGGWVFSNIVLDSKTGFNTQPPEGGWILFILNPTWLVSFNTQPPEGGWLSLRRCSLPGRRFQHTAARRRLGRLDLCQ